MVPLKLYSIEITRGAGLQYAFKKGRASRIQGCVSARQAPEHDLAFGAFPFYCRVGDLQKVRVPLGIIAPSSHPIRLGIDFPVFHPVFVFADALGHGSLVIRRDGRVRNVG